MLDADFDVHVSTMHTPVYVSKEGLEKLRADLHIMKTVRRRELADRIEKAKDLGDLRENADYQEAKDELGMLEGRIIELDDALRRAVIIEGGSSDSVSIGSTVTVTVGGREKVFRIVGSKEADPLKGLISNESPLGQALIGKKPGEEAEVAVPAGRIRYVIATIS